MPKTFEAVYKKGILRLIEPIELDEGCRVEIVIFKRDLAPNSPRDILAKIAALPIIGDTRPFSGEDHDAVLYLRLFPASFLLFLLFCFRVC